MLRVCAHRRRPGTDGQVAHTCDISLRRPLVTADPFPLPTLFANESPARLPRMAKSISAIIQRLQPFRVASIWRRIGWSVGSAPTATARVCSNRPIAPSVRPVPTSAITRLMAELNVWMCVSGLALARDDHRLPAERFEFATDAGFGRPSNALKNGRNGAKNASLSSHRVHLLQQRRKPADPLWQHRLPQRRLKAARHQHPRTSFTTTARS